MRTDHTETSPSPLPLVQLAMLVYPAFTRLEPVCPQGGLGRRTDFVTWTRPGDCPGHVCPPEAAGPEVMATATSSVSCRQERPAHLSELTAEGVV